MASHIVTLTVAGLALLGLSCENATRLVWNASASAPMGLYLWSPATKLTRGDLVLADPPVWVREFAAERGYLPLHVPLIKRIAALPHDRICGSGKRISINGQVIAVRLATDARHRPLPTWQGCLGLGNSEIFLLSTDKPGSFDGRYFGLVKRSAVKGRLRPLWLP